MREPLVRPVAATLVYAAAAAALVGCACPTPGAPPRDAHEALTRIDDNFAKLTAAVQCEAIVSTSFRDDRGILRQFIAHPATLVFEPPRCLAFEIRSTLGPPVARLGSDDERYWMYVELADRRKLWWGTWSAAEAGQARRLQIPPDQILDALLLRPLPGRLDDEALPLLDVSGDDARLLYVAENAWGRTYKRREVTLNDCPPYLPKRIVDRLPDDSVVMDATFAQYKPIEGAPPAQAAFVARKYVVYWWDHGVRSELRVDLGRASLRDDETPFCRFPSGWKGEVERLDASADPQGAAQADGAAEAPGLTEELVP